MKYIKTYENKNLEEYSGMLYINIPSENYFRSSVRFQLVFVDSINQKSQYYIKGDAFQRSEYTSGVENYSIIDWDQSYNEYEFKLIKFMTTKEFYTKYTDSFIKIINILLDKLTNKNLTDFATKRINDMLDRLTIPETEHIINANKFNL